MSTTDFTLPTMEEFATTDGDTRDAILLRALQHAGERFGAMTHDMEGLQGSYSRVENEVVALRQEVARSQELLIQAIETMGKASMGGPKESKSTKTARVAAPTPFKGDSELVDSYLAECWLHFLDNPTYKKDSVRLCSYSHT